MGSRRSFPVFGCLLASVVLLASMVPALVGAEPTASTGASHALCWRGHPLPECRSFLVTEVGLSYPMNKTATNGRGAVIAGDLGWMRNISDRAAVGGTAHARIGIGDDYARAGVRARYRRWLGRSGICLPESFSRTRMTTNSAINFQDWSRAPH